MEWSTNNTMPFAPRSSQPSSFAFLYNYNTNTDSYLYPPAEMKNHHQMMQVPMMEMNGQLMDYDNINDRDKKKRMTSEQLEALEISFQEEVKLDPDRKMKLAHELGLQPRQVAVWFQNRRARWKGKQLERLYDALKHEFEAVFREKQKLQDEVLALRTILKEHVTNKQAEASTAMYTDMSGEETVDSTPMATIHHHNNHHDHHHHHQVVAGVDCSNYMVNYDGTAMHTSPYSNWAGLPSYLE